MKSRNIAVIGGIIVAIAIVAYIAVIFGTSFINSGNRDISPGSSNVSSVSENASSMLFSRNSKPSGLSYEEWMSEWWKYFVAIPEADSPAADPTGAKCSINQNDDRVWFLAGAFQGKVTRTCEVPAGKALIGSFLGIECNERQDGPIGTLTECAQEGPKYLRFAELTIDGTKVPHVEEYKVTTPPINVSFPKGAVYGAPEGNYGLVGSGVMPIIKPLPPGNHVVNFKGAFDHPTNDVYDVAVDVTYNLIVK